MDDVDLPAGRTLTTEGKSSDTFFLILEGEVSVSVDGRERPALGPGDYFGEIGMLDRGPATATVVTRAPSRLLLMSHPQFRDALAANADLLPQIMAAVASRLRRDDLERQTT